MQIRSAVVTLFLCFHMSVILAQPGGGPPPDPGQPVPIGGIEILMLLGGALGARGIMKLSRKK